MSDLIVDKKYKVISDLGLEDYERYFKYNDNEGNYFAAKKNDAPMLWRVYDRCTEIPEDKHEEYSIETFPLVNTGMVRMKSWWRFRKSFSTITGINDDGIYVMLTELKGEKSVETLITWKDALREWEWLEKSGEVAVFGRRLT